MVDLPSKAWPDWIIQSILVYVKWLGGQITNTKFDLLSFPLEDMGLPHTVAILNFFADKFQSFLYPIIQENNLLFETQQKF